VPHLVCKGNMVVPYLDFRKSSEPVRSPCLIQLTQDQVRSGKIIAELEADKTDEDTLKNELVYGERQDVEQA